MQNGSTRTASRPRPAASWRGPLRRSRGRPGFATSPCGKTTGRSEDRTPFRPAGEMVARGDRPEPWSAMACEHRSMASCVTRYTRNEARSRTSRLAIAAACVGKTARSTPLCRAGARSCPSRGRGGPSGFLQSTAKSVGLAFAKRLKIEVLERHTGAKIDEMAPVSCHQQDAGANHFPAQQGGGAVELHNQSRAPQSVRARHTTRTAAAATGAARTQPPRPRHGPHPNPGSPPIRRERPGAPRAALVARQSGSLSDPRRSRRNSTSFGTVGEAGGEITDRGRRVGGMMALARPS